ncbi:aryl hydrocarbon receptor-like isoform X2 [Halichoeres trimaculatus]
MLGNPGSYANKKRKKPVLKQKKVSDGGEVVKSNPSKRHRDRLNGELDRLTDLLPFPEEVRSRLDKLSVLRLSVGYLRVKSYFKATMKTGNSSRMFSGVNGQNGNTVDTASFSEGDLLLQAMNGFVLVVTSDGSVFYSSPTIKDYLGFHQSDVVHQSVFELIHTDDRALFRQQLHFALDPPSAGPEDDEMQGSGNTMVYSPEQLPPENSSFLERSFVCRFRCLLDNSSGFLALKFQGRLKYLHGQRLLKENGVCDKPQLALFAIAVPVQAPAIVEIRTKMLLFQSKHKLDFTPMGIDSRGRVILGYSETELCMKGSGYQFIHAADMMYCADNHIRMMKTGESGMTVFRLLSKSGGWVWVKSNAKLIFKGGRPDFIIAYQRALVNAEGEEYLRQRRMQLPFSFTTGEGVLYDHGPTVDVTQFQFNKMFGGNETIKDGAPRSLLDCFLRQDETAYTKTIDPPIPLDQVFIDSHALVSVPSDDWLEGKAVSTPENPMVVKEESRQSVMAVINNLEQLAQNRDFCAALKNLDVEESELTDWENTLKRLSLAELQQSNVSSELDSIFTNDLFDYIDHVLFKEKGEEGLNAGTPACLSVHQQDLFSQAADPLCDDPQLFQIPSPDQNGLQINGIYAPQQNSDAQLFNSTQKLSHQGPLIPQSDSNLPPLQQLQLQDIFSPSLELPELTLPDLSASFPSCEQTSSSLPQSPWVQLQNRSSADGHFLQTSVKQLNHVASGVLDMLPPLIPCSDFNPSNTPNLPVSFPSSCLQGGTPERAHVQPVKQLPQSQTHVNILQNGPSLMPASQTFPHAGQWPSATGLNAAQQGGLACGQAASQSSCMFNPHFSSSPAGGDILALTESAALRGANKPLDQSPPQGSCYFQWSHSEPVVGTSVILQENANISPLSAPPTMTSEHALQHFMDCHRPTEVNMFH